MKRNTFSRLIQKYELEIQLIYQEEGSYIDGEYIDGSSVIEERKAVITPISERKAFDSGGSYTTQDFQLITREKIELEKNPYILYQGIKYHIEADGSYSNYVDVYNYIMKRVDSFDRPKTDDSCHHNETEAGITM